MSTIERLDVLFLFSLVVLSSFACFNPIQQVKADTWTWKDEFTDKNSRWDWDYSAGTGYKICPATVDGYVVWEGGITDQSTNVTYSDDDLSHNTCMITYAATDTIIVECRMRFSDTGLNPSVGSRGFGLYNGLNDMAMFMCCSEESNVILQGWRAIVATSGNVEYNELLSFDPKLWHTYRITVSPLGTVFKIDGTTVASTNDKPAPTTLDLTTWIDNGIYNLARTGQSEADTDQIQYVDYIAYYYSLDMTAPAGSIVINNGDSLTSSASVTLSLTYTDAGSGVSQVRYSNDGVWDTEAWEDPAASKSWTLTSGDGTKTVYYQIKDNAGLISSTYSDTITLSTTAPTGSIVINDGAAFSTSTSVTLSLTYTAPGSTVSQVRYSNDGVWDTEDWEAPAASKSWILTSGDETKTVYYQIKNSAEVVSTTYSDTIVLDTGVPTGSILINGGDAITSSASVSLSLTANDATSGVSQVRYSNDGVWDSEVWESFSASKSWTLTSSDGTKTVSYQIKDNAGLLSSTYSDTITLVTSGPTGSVVINTGDSYATSTSVTLSLTYADAVSGVSQVRYSNDGVWDTESWEAPAATEAWTLASGDGTKTVYYQVKNNAELTNTFSDTITLDTTAPTGSVVIDGGAASTSSTSVTLSLTYADSGSGVSQVRYSNDSVWDAESWEAPVASKTWSLTSGDGTKTVYFQIEDNAGLLSSSYSDTINLVTSGPTGSIVINNGDAATSSVSVTLSLTYADSGSGVSQVRYSNDGVWDTEVWEVPAATRAWTLPSGDGTKTVHYQVKNNLGVLSSTYSDTILLDTSPPAVSIIINGGSAYTNSTSVMLSLTASDATSGVNQVKFSNDGVWDTETWEAPSSTKPWALPVGDGAKTVYYQVKDNAGLVTTVSDSISLDMTKPTADAGQNQTVDAGAAVNFNAGGSTDNVGIVSYAWNFGDGATGTGISTTHVYSDSGIYTVSLTVEDAAGNIDTKSVTVTVQVVIPEFPPAALLTAFITITSALALSFRRKHKPSTQTI